MRRKLKRCIIFSSGNGVLGAIYSRLMEPIQYIPQRMIEGEGVSGSKRKTRFGLLLTVIVHMMVFSPGEMLWSSGAIDLRKLPIPV